MTVDPSVQRGGLEAVGPWLAVPRLLWIYRRRALMALASIVIAQVIAETVILILLAMLVNLLLETREPALANVAPPLAGLALLYLARFVLAPTAVALSASLDWHLRAVSGARLLMKLRSVPLADLEEPETAGLLARVRGISIEAAFKPRAVSLYAEAVVQRARLVVLLLIIAWFAWLPALLLLAGALLYYVWARREVITFLTGHLVGTDMFRRAGYFFELAVDRIAAKEVRLFGLGDWLVDRFRSHQTAGLDAVHRQRSPGGGLVLVAGVASLAIGSAFGMTLDAARQGAISAGVAALMGAAILIGAATLIAGEGWVWDLAAAPYARLLKLERAEHHSPQAESPAIVPRWRGDIEVDRLGFRYPRGDWVLRDLSLTIRRGRSLAIVGRNGAGKTTLVKLLCGLYPPGEGRIRVDGSDLHAFGDEAWRAQVAVIFQDFVRYPLTALDNLAVGRASAMAGSVLQTAVQRVGLSDVVARLPAALDTPLSRDYPGGIDLSGGEWQRVALARVVAAIQSGAQLMILDEPTASLDVEAEAEFNRRLLDLAGGVTTIIISHRFPTVRRADTIAVLDGGRVCELGSHAELMASDGLYARMFRVQAVRFEGVHTDA